MEIDKDIFYVGVNDRNVDFFEGLYKVPNGVSYNSYVISDEKIAVMDTVEAEFGGEWLENIKNALGGRKPDYLIIQHMEPDHSANVKVFADEFPEAVIVGNSKIFVMLGEYFGTDFSERRKVVGDGETLSLGKHELKFVFAPMVHWPEVMFTFDGYSQTLFSADAFGKFGALDCEEEWADEARRYYFGIVGKFGKQVTAALKKVASLGVKTICPLHGPVLGGDLDKYLSLYTKWAAYEPENDGVMIAYTSVYGHTEAAVKMLEGELKARGVKTAVFDLIRSDRSECVAKAFEYGKLVLATTTYNADIFPEMARFIDCLTARNYQKRTVAFVENGTWAPVAAKTMRLRLDKCADLTFAETSVKIRSSLNAESAEQIKLLADELSR